MTTPERRAKQREYAAKWKRKNYAHYLALEKVKRERKQAAVLGVSVEELHRLKALGCVLCGSFRRLSVDHDHQTGKGRGILCSACNAKMAWYENRIAAIADYLKRGNNGS